jgi:hypothetical protein
VRPGWSDNNEADQLDVTMLQGDRRRGASPPDGVISRCQIARVLIDSLTSANAHHPTFELAAERGPEQQDLGPDCGA